MTPAPVNLPTIWRGCSWGPVIFKWKGVDGGPFDLTGWQVKAESLNVNLNAQITDAVQGITTLSLVKTATAPLSLGVETWDWIWINPSGYRYPPFLAGKVPIKEPQTSNGQSPNGPNT